ncbi:hypothetical protein MRX96_002933 [Rhipicephalus microplus]
MWKSMERHVAKNTQDTQVTTRTVPTVTFKRGTFGILLLSPQTLSLEAFHGALMGFAPKSVCFSSDGMRARAQ